MDRFVVICCRTTYEQTSADILVINYLLNHWFVGPVATVSNAVFLRVIFFFFFFPQKKKKLPNIT